MATTKPGAPKVAPKIVINVKSSSFDTDNTREVSFEVSVFRGTSPLSGQMVILKEGLSRILNGTTEVLTDIQGVANLKTTFDLIDQEQHRVLRVCLDGLPEEISYAITLPAKGKKSVKKSFAETLMVMKYQRDNGTITFKARVLTNDGIGLKGKKVSMFFRGVNTIETTDASGEAVFSGITPPLKKAEETEAVFSVSGVSDVVRMKLRRKKGLSPIKAFTRRWWLGVNNGRAFLVMLAAVLFWVLTFSIGTGNPVINGMIFSDEQGLSSAERYYNQTAMAYGDRIEIRDENDSIIVKSFNSAAIKGTDNSDDYLLSESKMIKKRAFLKIAIFLTIAFLIYFPIAAREEIADAIEDIKLKMIDRSIVTAQDPFLERMVATMSTIGIIKNSKETNMESTTTTTASTEEEKEKKPFGSSFMSYLTLDLLTDLGMGIIKRIFGK